MTTTYDIEPNPIENGVQQVYNEIREWIAVILNDRPIAEPTVETLKSLDDAISNGWDELMIAFWQGVKQDIPDA